VHLAFALILSDPQYVGAGRLAVFQSDDGGVSWRGPRTIVQESALNPSPLDRRNGSMSLPNGIPFIYSAPLAPPFERVMSGEVTSGAADNRSADTHTVMADGAQIRVRSFTDEPSGRAYRYEEVVAEGRTLSMSYQYVSGTYSQTYVVDARGYRYRNSDGYEVSSDRRTPD